VGTGVWSTPSVSNITFEDQNDPNTLITSNIINTGHPTNPYFNLIWTEDNTNGCTDKDTIKVVFARIPTSNIEIIPPKCFGEPASIKADEDTLQQYTWNFFGGSIQSSNYNDLNGQYENFVFWNSEDTLHRISLIATNFWGCQSPITIDTVYEPAIPDFDVTIVLDTCMLGKGGLIFNDTNSNNSFFWLDTVFGPSPGPITTVYNLPTGEYDIRTSYQTANMTHYSYYLATFGNANCVDTLVYEIEPIGMIEAIIEISTATDMGELVAPEATVIFLNNSIYDNVGKRCEWHFDDGTTLKNCDLQVEHIYTESGCFNPFLIVMNRDLPECRDTAYLETCIPIDDASELEIPNVFSPNGDGINDFFQVKAQTLRSFNGMIVNRWGRTVYEWTNWQDYEAGWDGKINGGSDASPGVYYFVIKAVGMDDQEYEEQGPVHLVRD
jgi:gliding motility-associated-like protein